MVATVVIACSSFAATYYCNYYLNSEAHADYVSLVGALVVGVLGNIYSRFFKTSTFTVMSTGLFFLVPVSFRTIYS